MNQSHKTRVLEDTGVDPRWNENVKFDFFEGNDNILIKCLKKTHFPGTTESEDILLGEAFVNINEFSSHKL